ncbi:DUF6268 family outer membrane beta-barrel protein [Rufibacter glacialis]|uniref:DUF6268 family outer membrane beta-barrel protein n=1 Tax=Rufibacter glacialis TaxID=1259555 RepID=A0A5M8Q2U6_9BACT|nr:DUF6268 family outer membrane beta-barrel protein [Rufibacter glacialis]KAA6430217.1 hypothetical protein FOE74_20590 [Rufibacter glacialis]GGK87425.1 hypothetical protein GCM10011405_38930 [Rufibacter glacialis]
MKQLVILLVGVLALAPLERALGQGLFSDSLRAARAGTDPKELANPSVLGMGKSKGVIIRYERLPRFGMHSQGQQSKVEDARADVLRSNRFEFKAYAPLVNNPHFKLVLGGGYFLEEFNFKQPQNQEYPLYQRLEDKNLRSLDGQLVMLRPIDEKNYLIFRVKGELNGDYGKHSKVSLTRYLRTSMEAIYGWKKSPFLSYGLGVQLGYAFGRQTIYPALLYNRTFNDKWGVEAIFPANVTFRRNFSEKSLLYMGYRIEGATYNINIETEPFNQYETVELRKSEIKARFRWDREIYDFLWFALESGYRYNHRFNLYDGRQRTANPLIETHIKDAVYFNVELFLVPPRRFLKQ